MPTTQASDIVNDVITELSQVPSIAVQIYATARIYRMLSSACAMELDEVWWPRYMKTLTVGYDENGLLTDNLGGDLSTCDDYEDIQAVWPEGSNKKLRELPQSINPSALTSGKPWYVTPDYTYASRPVRVIPSDGGGNVTIRFRQHDVDTHNASTTTELDRVLLTYDCCWMYAVDDGTVPAQVQKYQMLAANRRKKLIAALAQQPLELDPRFPGDVDIMGDSGMNDWFTLDEDPLA